MNSGRASNLENSDTGGASSAGPPNDTETVASLVQRLGQPPRDLIDHLCEQFRKTCVDVQGLKPSRLPRTDLQAWCLDGDGKLLPTDAEDSFTSVLESNDPPGTEQLVAEFRTQLRRPRASQSGKRTALPDDLPESDSVVLEAEHSDAEQERRDKIAEMLTSSLIDRFGADVVEEPVEVELPSKKLQAIQPDRRFNWNMVLGVGTAAAILGMVYTGYHLTMLRETRVAGTPAESVVPASANPSTGADKDWRNPEVGDVEPLPPSSTSVFSSDKERSAPLDALETLESLNGNSGGSTRKSRSKESIDLLVDPSSLLAVDLPSGVVMPKGDGNEKVKEKPRQESQGSREAPATAKTGTLKEVLGDGESSSVPDSPQRIRAADVQFVALPRSLDSSQLAKVPGAAADFESIVFPIDVPVRLSRPDDEQAPLMLVSLSDQKNLAEIITKDGGSKFAWTDFAKADSASKQIQHGKITKSDGGTIFMRPAIEADPMKLLLGVRDSHPSWDIGWPILPKVSRLEVDILAPEDVEYAWVEPVDPTKPRRCRAVAVLTPPDGESVAIAVQFNIRCGSKLSCHLKYAARLDPSQPWQPLTKSGLNQISRSIVSQQHSMATRRATFEQFYSNADSMQRRLMRRKQEEMERAAEQIDATAKRIELLRSLAANLEDRVQVSFRLFVQWPDGQQQTILQTASPTKTEG
ncbi:MAG: hypothetical protein AAFX06_27315 [Planctomycetota bacterium]